MKTIHEHLIENATEIKYGHGAFGESERYKEVNKEKLIEAVVKDCILQIQLKIVRNGDTVENRRSHEHINDIIRRYGITL